MTVFKPTNDSLILRRARVTGCVYLLYFLTAVASGIIVKGIVLPSDGAATATNILARESMLRLGCAVGLLSTALYLVMAALFYELFLRVNRTVSILAAFFAVVGCAVQACGSLFQLTPLLLLKGNAFSAFSSDQVHALVLLFCKLQSQASGIEIVFFGFYDLLLGYLIYRSLFLPRWLGALMGAAGLGWLLSFAPSLLGHFVVFVEILGFLAEVVLMLWLLVKGIDVARWQEPLVRAKWSEG